MKKVSIDTSVFNKMTVLGSKKYAFDYYAVNLKGKTVLNIDRNITVQFGRAGINKMVYGRAAGKIKMACVIAIKEIVKNAVYRNFGEPKPKDKREILGYLNFNALVKSGRKVYKVFVVVRATTSGKYQYDLSIKVEPDNKSGSDT